MENATILKNTQIKQKVNSYNPHGYKLDIYDELSYGTYLTKITPKDLELLQKTVLHIRPNSINYEDSWGYIIQATRLGGFKWHDHRNGSMIFFGRKSKNNPTLIVASFFSKPKYLIYVLNLVQRLLKAPKIILKNVNPQDATNLISYGFRSYKKNERWCKEARFDDQTYPQLVIELKKLADKKGNAYKKLRNALNKKPNISIKKYHESDKNEVLEIFTLKDEESQNILKKSKGTYYSSHIMYLTSDLDKFVIIDNETRNIVGFTATSDISPVNTTLVASLFKPGFKIASVWGIYQTLIIKYHQGFRTINLGGCEKAGSYNFMRRTFQPSEELIKTHLVINYETHIQSDKTYSASKYHDSGNTFQIKSNNFFELL